ncbi:MAG: hypothetical protein V9H25_11675 [Candidatus Competibacter sp.]
MSDELFQTLLRELFEGDDDRLRDVLRPLTAEQRKVLFERFGELFKVLHRACRLRAGSAAGQARRTCIGLSGMIRWPFCGIGRPRWPRRARSTIRKPCKAACFNSALMAP